MPTRPLRTPAALENNRRISREAKQRRRGTCVDCGAETRYNGDSVNGPSRYCLACANKRTGVMLSGVGPNQLALRAALKAGITNFTELYKQIGTTKEVMGVLLNRELKAGRIVRTSRGHYRLSG